MINVQHEKTPLSAREDPPSLKISNYSILYVISGRNTADTTCIYTLCSLQIGLDPRPKGGEYKYVFVNKNTNTVVNKSWAIDTNNLNVICLMTNYGIEKKLELVFRAPPPISL